MKFILMFILTISFGLTACSSAKKPTKVSKRAAPVAGQLPDYDYEIFQPTQNEIMVIIDGTGKARPIKSEWDMDTSGHVAYGNAKTAKYNKDSRMPASVKKSKKSKKKKKKKRSKKKKRKKKKSKR